MTAGARTAMDAFDLYERAATDGSRSVEFLLAVHGGAASILAEDFCGSGALSRAWAEGSADRRVIAADADPAALDALRARLAPEAAQRVALRCADVRAVTDPADIIAAFNFPIGYWHARADLVAYFRHARSRLRGGGCLVVDIYGGATAFQPGEYEQALPGGIVYIWEQAEADALTGRVRNAMHFTLPGGRELRNAFEYDWRLWSIAEVREAMAEAGFARSEVYGSLGDAIDGAGRLRVRPLEHGDELDEDYVVYIAGRA